MYCLFWITRTKKNVVEFISVISKVVQNERDVMHSYSIQSHLLTPWFLIMCTIIIIFDLLLKNTCLKSLFPSWQLMLSYVKTKVTLISRVNMRSSLSKCIVSSSIRSYSHNGTHVKGCRVFQNEHGVSCMYKWHIELCAFLFNGGRPVCNLVILNGVSIDLIVWF